ncbi:MAG: TolC family protein [Acidobacteria bacterium]|jgi:HAE1 family hydrophobic/amphiphilic exporter-1|nr:TolC family protein [Acidobacteriota bacterium]
MSNNLQASKFSRQQITISFFSSAKTFALSVVLVFFATFAVAAQTPPRTTTPPTTNPPNPQQQQQQRPENEIRQNTAPQTRTEQQQTTAPAQPPTQQQTQTQTPQTPQTSQPSATNPNIPNAPNQTPNQSVGTSGGIAPAQLPDEPPPIAPNFEAPMRPLPSVERVGVDVSNQLPISLREAITLALQNNNDIDSSRINVQIAEFDLRGARGVYDPVIDSESYYERRTTPTSSTIAGGANGSVTQSDFTNAFGVRGFSPYAGGSYTLDYSNSRLNTTNQNATLNPQFPSALTLTYAQPLWRGFRFDNNRRSIEIAKKNLSLTDAQFRQQAVEIIAQVEQFYWDLAFSLRNLQVQIDAVKQARLQLESNQRLVSKGALAPIDIIAANTQITTFEQNVYTAQEAVTRAENNLKVLMLPDRSAEIWGRALVPVTPVELEIPDVPLEEAVSAALTNRQEIVQLQASEEINRINERYFRDQTKPQIDLVGSYTGNGLAGTPTARTNTGTNTTNTSLLARVNELSTLNNLPLLPVVTTTSTATVPSNLVGGYLQSLSNLATADYPTFRVGVRISLPFGNRIAKANLGRTLVEGERIKNQQAQIGQIIEADVRNTTQSLRSAQARLASSAASRASAEQLFESEQRQFRAGTGTVFLVLQRQNELVAARGRELQAQTDLNKAISQFNRATGTTLSANSVEITKGGLPNFLFSRPVEFGSSIFSFRRTIDEDQKVLGK